MTKPELEYYFRLWSQKIPEPGPTITLYQWLTLLHTAGKIYYQIKDIMANFNLSKSVQWAFILC